MFKELCAKIKEANTERGIICHYIAHFITTDGEKHINTKFRYGAPSKVYHSLPEYMMTNITSNGYLKDDDDVMYPLQNIVSITWECDDTIENVVLDEFRIFYEKPKAEQSLLTMPYFYGIIGT